MLCTQMHKMRARSVRGFTRVREARREGERVPGPGPQIMNLQGAASTRLPAAAARGPPIHWAGPAGCGGTHSKWKISDFSLPCHHTCSTERCAPYIKHSCTAGCRTTYSQLQQHLRDAIKHACSGCRQQGRQLTIFRRRIRLFSLVCERCELISQSLFRAFHG